MKTSRYTAARSATHSAAAGFSIMEVMLAVAIMGILAVMIGPSIVKKLGQVKENTTKSTMATLKSALQDYYTDIGHFPNKSEKGLDALVVRPKGKAAKKWDGPYIEGESEIPTDAWGGEFEYNAPPARYKDKFKRYELISFGESGEEGGDEEVVMGV